MKRTIIKLSIIACIVALCCGVAVGCSGTQTTSTLTEAQQQNREYMQNVNTIMSSFDTIYTNMSNALANGDTETAKQCVEDAKKTLESLQALEAPEALADIQAAYVSGGEKLVTSVQDYYDLFASSSGSGSDDYQAKIAAIQQMYNDGIDQLKAGDTAASSKE